MFEEDEEKDAEEQDAAEDEPHDDDWYMQSEDDVAPPSSLARAPVAAGPPRFTTANPLFLVTDETLTVLMKACGYPATYVPPEGWREDLLSLYFKDLGGVERAIVITPLCPRKDQREDEYGAQLEQEWATVLPLKPLGLRHWFDEEVKDHGVPLIRRTVNALLDLAPECRVETSAGPVVGSLASISDGTLSWVWEGRIPRGKLSLIVGDPGVGKSFLTLDLAARVTVGAPLPGGGTAPEGRALVFSAEDGVGDTVKPRITALGGNPRRVYVPLPGEGLPLTLDKLGAVRKYITETHSSLVVLDPLSAFVGKVNTFKDSEVRAMLAPLVALAEDMGVAVVGTMHLTKNTERPLLHRIQGSMAFIAVARSALLVARDGERSVVVDIKNNLAAPAPALAFTLREGVLHWEASPVPVEEVRRVLGLDTERDGDMTRDAVAFLRDLLSAGALSAREVLARGLEHGFSRGVLYRAKPQAGVAVEKRGMRDGWVWRLAGGK